MASSVKFTFDVDFGSRRKPLRGKPEPVPEPVALEPAEPPPPPPPTFSQEELEAARKLAYSDGMAAGENAARDSLEAHATAMLGAIADGLAQIAGAHDQSVARIKSEAVQLAMATALKLAGSLMARQPAAEVEALIAACLGDLGSEPRVVIRVPEPLVERLSEMTTGMAARAGFNGQIVLLGEPSLGPSDCRIEWADGGASRDAAEIQSQIEAAVARYLESPAETGAAEG
ncbi:MAG: hypothetical protein FJX46_12115 [Alphaproteobacteria bacterium]|nr:hypothetical protein [Alphaproteobacteria bacterium]